MALPTSRFDLKFFRQAGWMAMATAVGGVLMYSVHSAARLPPAEYSVFLVLLQVMNLMLIPAIGLQTVVAQQTASAVTPAGQRQLAAMIRALLGGVGVIWIVMALGAWLFQDRLLAAMQIPRPAALWVTVVIGLGMLVLPVLQGVLQGRQNFLWLGWLQVINGAGRLGCVFGFVWWLGGGATGAMLSALAGYVVTTVVAGWQARDAWTGPGEPMVWRAWVRKVVPLTLGLAASQFTMAADQILAQNTFTTAGAGLYGAAGTIGRGLIFFTGAVFAVMFPKAAASKARGGKTDVLAAALGATAVLGGMAALGCTLFPELPLRIVYASQPAYRAMAPLVPWFAWCMLPLSLANVLIGNLLARERFRAVPWLVLTAVGYGVALWSRQAAFRAAPQDEAFRMVVMTLGTFSVLLLVVGAWFTWGEREAATMASDARGNGGAAGSLT